MNLGRFTTFVQPGTRTPSTRSKGDTLDVNTGRKRTAQACDKCRGRKTKCSGERPVCQRCATRGLICQYSCREQKGKISSVLPSPEGSLAKSPISGSRIDQTPGQHRPHSISPPSVPSLSGSRASSRTMDSPTGQSKPVARTQPPTPPYMPRAHYFPEAGSLTRFTNRYSPYDYQAPRSLRGHGRHSPQDHWLSLPDKPIHSLSEPQRPPNLEFLSPSSWPHNQESGPDAGHSVLAYPYEENGVSGWDYSSPGGESLSYPPYSPISPPRLLSHGIPSNCFPEEQVGNSDGFLPTLVYDCSNIGPTYAHLG